MCIEMLRYNCLDNICSRYRPFTAVMSTILLITLLTGCDLSLSDQESQLIDGMAADDQPTITDLQVLSAQVTSRRYSPLSAELEVDVKVDLINLGPGQVSAISASVFADLNGNGTVDSEDQLLGEVDEVFETFTAGTTQEFVLSGNGTVPFADQALLVLTELGMDQTDDDLSNNQFAIQFGCQRANESSTDVAIGAVSIMQDNFSASANVNVVRLSGLATEARLTARSQSGDVLSEDVSILLDGPEGVAEGIQIDFSLTQLSEVVLRLDANVADCAPDNNHYRFSLANAGLNEIPIIISSDPFPFHLEDTEITQKTYLFEELDHGFLNSTKSINHSWLDAGDQIVQTGGNTDAQVLLLPGAEPNQRITVSARSNEASGSFGMVFSFQSETQFAIFEWRAKANNLFGESGAGMSVKVVALPEPAQISELVPKLSNSTGIETLFTNDVPFVPGEKYELVLDKRPNEVVISVYLNESNIASITLDDSRLKDGRVGLYSLSADNLAFSLPDKALLAPRQFTHQVLATDPDGDSLTYSLSEGGPRVTLDELTGILKWQPAGVVTAQQIVMVKATDAHGAFDERLVTLRAKNLLPAEFVSTPPGTTTVGESFNYQPIIANATFGNLPSFSLNFAPVGIEINSATGAITWVPDSFQAGLQLAEIAATDRFGLTAVQGLEINVVPIDDSPNPTPNFAISSNPPASVLLGESFEYQLVTTESVGNGVVSYSLAPGAPSGVLIDSATGLLAWPDAGPIGLHELTVLAEDLSGQKRRQSFLVEVVEPSITNSSPILAQPEPLLVTTIGQNPNGTAVRLENWEAIHFEDLPMQPQPPGVWSLSSNNTVASQNVNGSPAILLAPQGATSQVLRGNISVDTASDNDFIGFAFGYRNEKQFWLLDWKKTAQTLANLGNPIKGEQGISIKRIDSDTDISGLELWPTTDTSGKAELLYFNPIKWEAFTDYNFEFELEPGSIHIRITRGQETIDDIRLVDSRFQFGRFGFYNYSQGNVSYSGFTSEEVGPRPVSLHLLAEDADMDDLSFQLKNAPEGMHVDEVTGEVVWLVTPENSGKYTVTAHVDDGRGGRDSVDFEATAITTNPPIFTTRLSSRSLHVGFALRDARVTAVDPDLGDEVVLSILSGPVGMSLDTTSGLLKWTPADNQQGRHKVEISATDNTGLQTVQSFVIEVPLPRSEFAPIIVSKPPLMAQAGSSWRYEVKTRSRILKEIASYQLVSGPNDMQFVGDGMLEWNVPSESPSPVSVTIAVVDETNRRTSQSFEVAVMPISEASPPRIVSKPPTIAFIDQSWTYPVSLKGGEAQIKLVEAPSGVMLDESGQLSWTPTSTQFGTQFIEIEALANGRGQRQRFSVEVLPFPMNSPDFTSTPLVQASPNQAYSYRVTTSDSDLLDLVHLELVLAPEGMQLTESLGSLTWTPTMAQIGDHQVVIRALDRIGLATEQSFQVSVVDEALVVPFGFLADSSAVAGQSTQIEIQLGNIDASKVLLSLIEAPSGLVLSTGNQVRWTPGLQDVGVHRVVIEASGPNGLSQQFSASIHVLAETSLLAVGSNAPMQHIQGQELRFSLTVGGEIPGVALSFELRNQPDGMHLGVLGRSVQWLPSAEQVGHHRFTAVVHDELGREGVIEIAIEVLAAPFTRLQRLPEAITKVGENYRQPIGIVDSLGVPVALELTQAPDGLVYSEDLGELRWTPETSDIGTHTVSLLASSTTVTFELRVGPAPVPPVINSMPLLDAVINSEYLYQVVVEEVESQSLQYLLVQSPAGMTISTVGEVSWLPVVEDLGNIEVEIAVVDSEGKEDRQQFALNVVSRAGNKPPVWKSVPSTISRVGAEYRYSPIAIDPEGRALFLELEQAPVGVSFDFGSGLLTWSPTEGQQGVHAVTLSAVDFEGSKTSQTFSINVGSRNRIPVIAELTDLSATTRLPFFGSIMAQDDDSPGGLFFEFLNGPAGLEIESSTGLFSWVPQEAESGRNTVEVQVTDAEGGRSVRVFDIQVAELADVNQPPEIASEPSLMVTAGSMWVYTLSVDDVNENDEHFFELLTAPSGMNVDSQGRLSWLPLDFQEGSHSVSVEVTDVGGATSVQSFVLEVLENGSFELLLGKRLVVAGGAVELFVAYENEILRPSEAGLQIDCTVSAVESESRGDTPVSGGDEIVSFASSLGVYSVACDSRTTGNSSIMNFVVLPSEYFETQAGSFSQFHEQLQMQLRLISNTSRINGAETVTEEASATINPTLRERIKRETPLVPIAGALPVTNTLLNAGLQIAPDRKSLNIVLNSLLVISDEYSRIAGSLQEDAAAETKAIRKLRTASIALKSESGQTTDEVVRNAELLHLLLSQTLPKLNELIVDGLIEQSANPVSNKNLTTRASKPRSRLSHGVPMLKAVNQVYGEAFYAIGRSVAIWAIADIFEAAFDTKELNVLVTGGSLSFKVFGARGTFIESEVVGAVPASTEVILIGPDVIDLAVEILDDLSDVIKAGGSPFKQTKEAIDAIEDTFVGEDDDQGPNLGDVIASALNFPDQIRSCYLTSNSNECRQAIFSEGLNDVYDCDSFCIPSPVFVIVHNIVTGELATKLVIFVDVDLRDQR